MISFAWPRLLGLLALVAALGVGYGLLDRRRRDELAALAAQGFVPTAASIRMYRRRHLPVALFGVALTLMLVAVGRPRVRLTTSQREGTVVLAFDVSNSMRATDLRPTRLGAAQRAARGFVERQPRHLRVGVVAFNGGGVIMQRPTMERSDVLAAIDRLKPNGPTSLGQGMFSALSAIAGAPLSIDPLALGGERAIVPYLGSAAIIVFTDGENTSTPEPIDVAKLASVAGVKIYTVGIGLEAATVLDIDGFKVATTLDEPSLTEIAKVTNGKYFRAVDAADLASVYGSIELQSRSETKPREITSFLTGLSTCFLVLGSALAMHWFGRML